MRKYQVFLCFSDTQRESDILPTLAAVNSLLGAAHQTQFTPVENHPCYSFTFKHDDMKEKALRYKLTQMLSGKNVDYLLSTTDRLKQKYRLAIFVRTSLVFGAADVMIQDVDGTLLDAECIDEVAREAGVVDQVAKLTKKAMEEDWDFTQALRERLALVEGLPEEKLEEVFSRLLLKKGVASLVKTLKENGIQTAMVSGGFTYFTDRIAARLGFDYAFANVLEISGGKLTGKSLPPVVDGKMKLKVLEALCKRLGCTLSQSIAMGDGSNDKFMVGNAGLGVAFHAKTILKQHTPHHVDHSPMNFLCHFLGYEPSQTSSLDAAISKHPTVKGADLIGLSDLIAL
ncbi:phosphoserine phosphatase SerB [Planoprotostelium fungivorum]|uniref:phosphoserine phosphatase n=1 Tax=Planoprotostelium fungivorum TaxID=1890364 RepID=A0A2P6MUG7_9EUKA|nr:phosphoserine phosphatase SerB [Planoprotostelium fungivorum]